jgi:hypothetical protein
MRGRVPKRPCKWPSVEQRPGRRQWFSALPGRGRRASKSVAGVRLQGHTREGLAYQLLRASKPAPGCELRKKKTGGRQQDLDPGLG